eukprot:TRINITY_DN9658_c0_g1_i2.p2 TRINITY_DN9658_c0_g1~~TRINITY_DN9658_c0_g1_i2.p2  ORF type:complete len:357 (+),score=78.43 TRINITY_DN9658_c0_g1_i2:1368-2438(+)
MATFAELKAMRLPKPLLVGLDEIEGCVQDYEAVIDLQAEGFRAYSQGKVSVPPVQSMGQPPFHPFVAGGEAQTCVKSGYVEGDEHYVIKVAPGGVRENEERGLPVNTGLNLLFSQRTARLEAIFFDEGLLTEIRTAAAAALGAKLLAPRGSALQEIGLLGAGVQARWQLRVLSAVTPCRRVRVHARDAGRVQRFCADMRSEGWDVTAAQSAEELACCQLIHTTTPAREPLLWKRWFLKAGAAGAAGVHVNAMGADVPGKQELDPELVAAADLLVCDSRAQTFERGEFQAAASLGLLGNAPGERVLEIGELLQKDELLRRDNSDPRLTIFDSSGVAVQDIMITRMVYEALKRPRASL